VEIVVQINGKLRDRFTVPAGTTKSELETLALKSAKVQSYMDGLQVAKVIVVPNKLVNLVVKTSN
jgi:leucyl-tRNA synthetase